MAIAHDAGPLHPVQIMLEGSPIAQLYAGKIIYYEKRLKSVIKEEIRGYRSERFHYTPNPDYNAAQYLCDKLNRMGLEVSVKIINQ